MTYEELREEIARALCDRVNHTGDYDENKELRAPGWLPMADLALAVTREALIRAVPPDIRLEPAVILPGKGRCTHGNRRGYMNLSALLNALLGGGDV